MPRARNLHLASALLTAAVLAFPARLTAACEELLVSASRGQGTKGASRVAPLVEGTPRNVAAGQTVRPRTYSASGIEDLNFRLRNKELPLGALLELRIEMPGGHHYQTLAAPLPTETLADTKPGKTARVEGYPFPVAVRTPRRVTAEAGGRATLLEIPFTLPVAGSTIVSSSLYGVWKVTPLLDGRPCGTAAIFALDP